MQQRNNKRNKKKTKGVVRAPVAQNRSSRQSGQNGMTYKESERILTVVGSVAFAVTDTVRVNPGLAESFPWLSGHAGLYEKYKFKRLKFRYKNLKGTGSDGNIIMSFDYDTLDQAPSSAIEMTQSTKWIDGSPWRIFDLDVPVANLPYLYTRTGSVAFSDLKTYDIGQLHIAAEGCADTSSHGYLEVEYEVHLKDKQPSSASVTPTPPAAMFNLSANQALTTGGQRLLALDEEVYNGILASNSSGVITVPAGVYLIEVDISTAEASTIEALIDSASMVPPSKAGSGSDYDMHVSTIYASTASFTVSVGITISVNGNALADECRLIILRL